MDKLNNILCRSSVGTIDSKLVHGVVKIKVNIMMGNTLIYAGCYQLTNNSCSSEAEDQGRPVRADIGLRVLSATNQGLGFSLMSTDFVSQQDG